MMLSLSIDRCKAASKASDYTQKQRSSGKEHHKALLPNTVAALVQQWQSASCVRMRSPANQEKGCT